MSSSSIFTSSVSEKRWVLSMSKNFPQHHIVDIDSDAPYVFKVPKTLTEEKPEAYAPHHVGLGPYHHLQPDLYIMQKQKLAAITKFLSPEKLQKFQLLVEALIQSEPILRACYDQYLDLDIETLAWIIAIDGMYLLQFLKNYPEIEENLRKDILMLENQIPVILLEKILQVLELEQDFSLFEEFQSFCQDQSPLRLSAIKGDNFTQAHLLHLMYYLILNKTKNEIQFQPFSAFSGGMTRILLDDVSDGVQFLAERGLPGAAVAGNIISFVQKIPWDRILGLFKKGNNANANAEKTPLVEEIDIPSVSQMSEIAGIKFTLTPGGIRDIEYDDGEEVKNFYLPVITINATSEIVLRNLVAFEAALSNSSLEMAEYVDLMCGIIDSSKDVEILRKEGIIESELGDEEIARIFNGIGKSRKRDIGDNSNIEEAIVNVNARYGSSKIVKVKRFLEKYVYGLFKILSVLITIAVMVLLLLQAFCSVFGCGRWFGKVTMQGKKNLVLSF